MQLTLKWHYFHWSSVTRQYTHTKIHTHTHIYICTNINIKLVISITLLLLLYTWLKSVFSGCRDVVKNEIQGTIQHRL